MRALKEVCDHSEKLEKYALVAPQGSLGAGGGRRSLQPPGRSRKFNMSRTHRGSVSCYTTTWFGLLRDASRAEQYMACLRDKCKLVADKWTERGQRFVHLYFRHWRQEAVLEDKARGRKRAEASPPSNNRTESSDPTRQRTVKPGAVAQGVRHRSPPLPDMGGHRGKANALIIDDEDVHFSSKMKMKGPADVVMGRPGLLCMGAYPSRPKRLCATRDFDFEEGESAAPVPLFLTGFACLLI